MAVIAKLRKAGKIVDYTPSAALSGGAIVRLNDGRAAVIPSDTAAGDLVGALTEGLFTVPKTANFVFIDGQEIWWDVSAGAAVIAATSDVDFYLGIVKGDATSSATTCDVLLNELPAWIIDTRRDAHQCVPVLTAGTPTLMSIGGGGALASFSLTAEAQKLDLLSRRSFPTESNWIFEALVELVLTADADVCDVSIGVASGTHASDADQITNSAFFHLDLGADLNIDVESDNVTNEVAATDSTVDIAAGVPVLLQIDGRDTAALKYYINGVRVNDATALRLDGAVGPLKALFHVEKSANDSPGQIAVHKMGVRLVD